MQFLIRGPGVPTEAIFRFPKPKEVGQERPALPPEMLEIHGAARTLLPYRRHHQGSPTLRSGQQRDRIYTALLLAPGTTDIIIPFILPKQESRESMIQ
jgi:hypothetical protein